MKKLIIVLTMVLITGCIQPAESTANSSNTNFQVEKLFTTDGITVYRFYDAGHYRYFTSKGETTYQLGCGKNCSRSETISSKE